METEIEKLKRENETLKHENAELRETNDKLKESLDEAVRGSKPKPKPAPRGLKPANSQSQASSETADNELRKLIKDLQDRLTIAEQVTAATQRRELEHAYENIPAKSVYEELRFDPTQEHVYTALQKTTHTGCITVSKVEIRPRGNTDVCKKLSYRRESSLGYS